MKPNLLNDVLKEGDYARFRESLAVRIEAEARRKRMQRRSIWLALAASITVLFIISARVKTEPPQIARRVEIPAADSQFRTHPIDPEQILTTQSFAPGVAFETRSAPQFVFATDPSRGIDSISDSELLDLFPNCPTGLLAVHGRMSLVFLDPEDAATFMSAN